MSVKLKCFCFKSFYVDLYNSATRKPFSHIIEGRLSTSDYKYFLKLNLIKVN